ncbi:hypothetical protein [Parasitella parasitica]|uniref:Uncharacterized protein n=1 Tax=Parasitella parasitica TaxID=35722 RepID=A0A0B7NSM2_9FUNG|nr:hypothetical protein [Parasitella parasitica]
MDDKDRNECSSTPTSSIDDINRKKLDAMYNRLLLRKSIDGSTQLLENIEHFDSGGYVAQYQAFLDISRELVQKYNRMLRALMEKPNHSTEEEVRVRYHIDVLELQRQVIQASIRECKFIALLDGKEKQINMATQQIRALQATLKIYRDAEVKRLKRFNMTVPDFIIQQQSSEIAKKREEELNIQKCLSRNKRPSTLSEKLPHLTQYGISSLGRYGSQSSTPAQEIDSSSPVREQRNEDLYNQVYSLCSSNGKPPLSSLPGGTAEVQDIDIELSNMHVLDSANSMQTRRKNSKDNLSRGKQSEYTRRSSKIDHYTQWNEPNPNDTLAKSRAPQARKFTAASSVNGQKRQIDPNIKNLTLKPFTVPSQAGNKEPNNMTRLEAGFSPSPPMAPRFAILTKVTEPRNPPRKHAVPNKMQAETGNSQSGAAKNAPPNSMRRRMGLLSTEIDIKNAATLISSTFDKTVQNKGSGH